MKKIITLLIFFFSSRRRHTRLVSDWSSDVCSSDLVMIVEGLAYVLAPSLIERVLEVLRSLPIPVRRQ